MKCNTQLLFEHIFAFIACRLRHYYQRMRIIILFALCRYAHACAFISVIELPRIPAYCPKKGRILQQPLSCYNIRPPITASLTKITHQISRMCDSNITYLTIRWADPSPHPCALSGSPRSSRSHRLRIRSLSADRHILTVSFHLKFPTELIPSPHHSLYLL